MQIGRLRFLDTPSLPHHKEGGRNSTQNLELRWVPGSANLMGNVYGLDPGVEMACTRAKR